MNRMFANEPAFSIESEDGRYLVGVVTVDLRGCIL